ncbi:MAG: potassium channel family protein [Thermodesulfobacteriota bacterium]
MPAIQFTFNFLKTFCHGLVLAAPLLLFFLIMIVLLGQLAGRKESWSRFDSLYWSFITATTVGYGDIRPLERSSRILSIIIAFFGLILTGIIVALALHAATITFESDTNLIQLKGKL